MNERSLAARSKAASRQASIPVRTFQASSRQEALRRVRDELGREATVLETRVIRGGLWQRLLGRIGYEVDAVALNQSPRPATRPPAPQVPASAPSWPAAATPAPPVPAVDQQEFRRRVLQALDSRNPHRSIDPLDLEVNWSDEQQESASRALASVFQQMTRAGVPEQTARELIHRVYDLEEASELGDELGVRLALARAIRADAERAGPLKLEPGKPHTVAVVGPSGTGKTSTLVKLAAWYRLECEVPVAMITADTYRLAAPEQLRAFAELMEIPCDIVTTPREMYRATQRHGQCGLILIDSAGRNPRDSAAMSELRRLLDQARPDEVLVVLSAAQGAGYLADAVAEFTQAGGSSLALTMLDQCQRLGNLLPLFQRTSLPIRYTTWGQNVRRDLREASLDELLPRMLGGFLPRVSRPQVDQLASLSYWQGHGLPAESAAGGSTARAETNCRSH